MNRSTLASFTRRPCSALVLGLLLACPALQAAAQPLNIPALPLDQSLNALAAQAGIQLVFSTALTESHQAPALLGDMETPDALHRLLQGSGLQAKQVGPLSYTIIRPAATDPQQLEAVQVRGRLEDDTSGTYTTQALSFGRGQSQLDVPQTVSVITRQRIEDQNLNNLSEVLNQTTGVTVTTTDFGISQFSSRGFFIDSYQYDGGAPVSGQIGYSGNVAGSLDMAQFDRVEVLRGADALYSGSGEPGGVVNLVHKRPTAQRQIQGAISLGSWRNRRVELDVGGPLNDAGSLRGRAVAAYQDRHTFYDTARYRTGMMYGILEADLSPAATVSLSVSHQRNRDVPADLGLPRYSNGDDLGLPRSTSFVPDWNHRNAEVTQVFGTLDYRFNDDWQLRVNAMHQRSTAYIKAGYVYGGVDPLTGAGAYWNGSLIDSEGKRTTADATLTGHFRAFGQRHTLRVGADMRRYHGKAAYATGFFGAFGQPVDVFDPTMPPDMDVPPLDQFYDPLSTRERGLFAALTLQMTDQLDVILGGRHASYKLEESRSGAWGSGRLQYEDKNVLIPYGGVVFRLSPNWATYASIAETYVSQASRLQAPLPGSPMDPITGRNYEVGVKGSILDQGLDFALALYRIERKGQAVRDPAYPSTPGELGSNCCFLAQGHQVSQGVDLELSGELAPGWQIFAGYTFNSNKDKQTNIGPFSTTTPKHLFKLHTHYQAKGEWSRWSVGGGVNIQSAQFTRGTASTWNPATGQYDGPSVAYAYRQSGYAVWNAQIGYRISANWQANLNLENLFDRKYYQTMGTSSSGNWYGQPFNWMLTLRGTF